MYKDQAAKMCACVRVYVCLHFSWIFIRLMASVSMRTVSAEEERMNLERRTKI